MKDYIVPTPPSPVPVAQWKMASPPSPPRECLKLGPVPTIQPTMSPPTQPPWMTSSSTLSEISSTSTSPHVTNPPISTETDTLVSITNPSSTPQETLIDSISTASTTQVSMQTPDEGSDNNILPTVSPQIEGSVDCTKTQYYRHVIDCRKVCLTYVFIMRLKSTCISTIISCVRFLIFAVLLVRKRSSTRVCLSTRNRI